MRKIFAFVMAVVMLVMSLDSVAFAAVLKSQNFTLDCGRDGGYGVYLYKNQQVTITITQTAPYSETSKNTYFPTGSYNPDGYNTKLGVSVNNSAGKNLLYKTFKLNYSKYNKRERSYTFKAKESGMHWFFIRNNTKVSNGMRVSQVPSYTLTVSG